MSNTGGGRDDEIRDDVTDASSAAPNEGVTPGEQATDATPAAPAESRGTAHGDTAVLGDELIAPADDREAAESAAPAPAATTPPAQPGPLGPGDTAVVDPVVTPAPRTPDSVEPPVGGTAANDLPSAEAPRTAAIPADPELPSSDSTEYAEPRVAGAQAGSVASGSASAASGTTEPDASETDEYVPGAYATRLSEPGAPVDEEPADAQSRLDAAVQRANAVPAASDSDREQTPEPIAADSVRRETYVPPAAGAAVAGAATVAGAPHAPQTVYVQAPTPPKAKSNRGFGVLVALIGSALFAALYAGVAYLLFWGQYGSESTEQYVEFLSRPTFYVPIVAMFVGFALLAIIVNRGAWWKHAVFGLLVGVLVYFSYIGAVLLVVRAWELTPQEAADVVRPHFLSPLAIAAGVIAREIPIWLGGWIAKRGRGVAERNRLAMEAYDRELAAGPRPVAR